MHNIFQDGDTLKSCFISNYPTYLCIYIFGVEAVENGSGGRWKSVEVVGGRWRSVAEVSEGR